MHAGCEDSHLRLRRPSLIQVKAYTCGSVSLTQPHVSAIDEKRSRSS